MNSQLSDTNFLSKTREYLLKRQKQVKESLESIEKNDSFMTEALAESSSELSTASWEANVRTDAFAMKSHLMDLLGKINQSLQKIRTGVYGTCDKCGKEINVERLAAMPMTALCIVCIPYLKT